MFTRRGSLENSSFFDDSSTALPKDSHRVRTYVTGISWRVVSYQDSNALYYYY